MAQEPEVKKGPKMGIGAHTYEWSLTWGRRPDGKDLGNTHGCIQVDKAGRIYCNTDTRDAVMVFDRDGKLLSTWGNEFKGGLHGMTLVSEGGEEFLYLAHTGRHEVAKATLEGRILWTMGYPKSSGLYKGSDKYLPTSVAIAPNGDIFVADGYGMSWIHQFSKDRKYVRSFGGPGTEPGKLRTPHGLLMDTRADPVTLLVADRENHRLQRFDLKGKHLEVIEGMFRRPCNIALNGTDLAVPDLAGRVTILNDKNELVVHLGDQPDPKKRARNDVPKSQWAPGVFLSPHGAAFDGAGNLYVLDWNRHGRLTQLKKKP